MHGNEGNFHFHPNMLTVHSPKYTKDLSALDNVKLYTDLP